MNYSLALSLGHNSSAVLISPDGEILAGYETERFDQIKSSSQFPIEPIERLLFNHCLDYNDVDVYIGHWFTSGKLPDKSTKHCNLEVLKKFNGVNSLSQDFTHHDSHLESAMVFAGAEFYGSEPTYAFVMDGFGTMGECISIYHLSVFGYSLKQRVFGYNNSLGMLYQYATDYMGMKMNNHEYKILAYEVHINDIDCNKQILTLEAENYAKMMLENIFSGKFVKDEDPVVNVSALQETHARIHKFLQEALENANVDTHNIYNRRVATAYLVQRIVEIVVLTLRRFYPSKNLLLVGGLFYNVKLNNLLADTCEGKICVMPLAGDQGAGLGVYQAYNGDLKWPDNLFWGSRDLFLPQKDIGLMVFDSMRDALPVICEELHRIGFVNIVRGAMEFGPRALCNTSTLAIPDIGVTNVINQINNRTAEMPMAPVVTRSQAEDIFVDVDKVHKSLEYMIITRNYKDSDVAINMSGAAHYYPDQNVFTGRPQITEDPYICQLLEMFGPLVNTSFNYHGLPIVFEEDTIRHTHLAQYINRPDLNLKTIVIRN
jgi:predicted NodU family carbamoyl transferase